MSGRVPYRVSFSVGAGLSESTRHKLQEAQNLFAQAEASTGSDDTVAMMLYQQFNSEPLYYTTVHII